MMIALYIILGIIGWLASGFFCMAVALYLNEGRCLVEDLFNGEITALAILGPLLIFVIIIIIPYKWFQWIADNYGSMDISWIVLFPWKILTLPLTFCKFIVRINNDKNQARNQKQNMEKKVEAEKKEEERINKLLGFNEDVKIIIKDLSYGQLLLLNGKVEERMKDIQRARHSS